jgi:hypothetical protein
MEDTADEEGCEKALSTPGQSHFGRQNSANSVRR